MRREHGKGRKSRSTGPENLIFDEINKVRTALMGKDNTMKWQKGFSDMAVHWAVAGEQMQVGEDGFVMLSSLVFSEDYPEDMPPEELVQKWLLDPSKRPIVLAPANYGVVALPDVPDKGRCVAVMACMLFRPKS